MGTKRKDRIRGYGSNGSEMYSQWYQHFDDNYTQSKSRRGIIKRSKKYDDLQGQRGYDPLIGKHSVGGGGGAGGSVDYRYFSSKRNEGGGGAYYDLMAANYTSDLYEFEPARDTFSMREKKEGDYQEATFFDPFGSLNDNSTQGKSRRGFFRSSSKDDDYLQGGKGRDKLRGGKGDDELQGQRGHDHLRGGKGDDYLIGGEGNDYLKGGKGDDVLIGGAGQDKLKGGKGADIFDVESDTEKGSKCIIKDFNPDEGDKISAADNVSIEMKGDRAIIEADGATTICKFDSDYRPNNDPPFRPWFTDPTSTIVDVVEG